MGGRFGLDAEPSENVEELLMAHIGGISLTNRSTTAFTAGRDVAGLRSWFPATPFASRNGN
jgi:hypothetical protein